jgi:serine protease
MQHRRSLLLGSLALTSLVALLCLQADSPSEPGPETQPLPGDGPQPERRVLTTRTAGEVGRAVPRQQVAAESAAAPYRAGEVMVAAETADQLNRLADELEAEVLRPPGRSGLGLLRVAPERVPAVVAALAARPGGPVAVPNGKIIAASSSSGEATRAEPLQWHLDAIGAPLQGEVDASGIVVAVLDSGVAYAVPASALSDDNSDSDDDWDAESHAAAPSLAGSAIVAPHDFVDGDSLALDEHQHGTFIASIIASQGTVEGVAPGASLMPLRVLDEDCSGSELDLIEALHHAAENGADVVNMSLSFPAGYVPSRGLRDALQAVHESGALMVAASGNTGAEEVSWPAASPLVIAVSSFSQDAQGGQTLTDYGNLGLGLDILAPGGDLSVDADGDGLADGIVAETIGLQEPDEVGLWMFAGTSQAAAVVSGAVAELLAAGVDRDQVVPLLHSTAESWDDWHWIFRDLGSSFRNGTGAGGLDLGRAMWRASMGHLMDVPAYGMTMLPYLELSEDGASIRPVARMWAVDDAGQPPPAVVTGMGVRIWDGDGFVLQTCLFENDGTCSVQGDWVPVGTQAAWAFQAESIGHFHEGSAIVSRPRPAVVVPDALELINAALSDTGLSSSPLGLRWTRGVDPELGSVEKGWSVMNLGTGLSSSPLGIVATNRGLDFSDKTTVKLDLDGTGLSSSPLGVVKMKVLRFDGTGLSSSPLGYAGLALESFDMVMLGGSSLASSPLGFRPQQLAMPDAAAWDEPGIGMDGQFVVLDGAGLAGTALAGTSVGSRLESGGWVTASGHEGAALLVGSGVTGLALGQAGAEDSDALGARELDGDDD